MQQRNIEQIRSHSAEPDRLLDADPRGHNEATCYLHRAFGKLDLQRTRIRQQFNSDTLTTPSLPTTAILADAPSAITYSSGTMESVGKYTFRIASARRQIQGFGGKNLIESALLATCLAPGVTIHQRCHRYAMHDDGYRHHRQRQRSDLFGLWAR